MTQHDNHTLLSIQRLSGTTCRLYAILLASLAQISCIALEEGSQDSPKLGSSHHALTAENGLTVNGMGSNGLSLNGLSLNGLSLNGLSLNGLSLNGLSLNGLSLNGLSLNGLSLNGLSLNGLSLNGLSLNGLSLNGLSLNGLSLNGIPVTSSQETNVQNILGHLGMCALNPGDCFTAYDLDDTPRSYCGLLGHDPGWKGSNPDLTKAGVMGQCVHDRALAAGDSVTVSYINRDAFKVVFGYLARCALDAGDSATLYDENGTPLVYAGALGLAPEWRTGPLSERGQRLISACLGASANGAGVRVQLSVRGPDLTPASAVERAVYRHREGSFWGNLFAAEPNLNTCTADGNGPWGRICTSGSCGFTNRGTCETACATQDSLDGYFEDCGPDSETAVVSTFLNYSRRLALGGSGTTCVRRGDGPIECWGENTYGEVGIGTTDLQTTPVEVLPDAAYIAGGREHTCAIRELTGEVWCWGRNKYGTLGVPMGGPDSCGPDGDDCSKVPIQVVGLSDDVAQLTSGYHHTCALLSDGTARCWGRRLDGRLGDGAPTTGSTSIPQQVLLDDIAYLAPGRNSHHTCAMQNDGDIWCWGRGFKGQLGNGGTDAHASPVQAQVSNSVSVCTGAKHSCARREDGSIHCWGLNAKGQIGDGTQINRLLPTPALLPGPAVGHDCGANHTCAVLDDDTVWCWGRNQYRQLGDGTTQDRSQPVQVLKAGGGWLDDVTSLSASVSHSCATRADGTIYCWGRNATYQLGNGSDVNQSQAVRMTYQTCGNGTCEASYNESCTTCSADCNSCN